MKNENENTIEILNDLLRINNDRMEGYKKAFRDVMEDDLRNVFAEMAGDSLKNAYELERELRTNWRVVDPGSTPRAGKIYRIWTDVKTACADKYHQSILSSCECGEKGAQSAYLEALSSNDLPTGVRHLVRIQQIALKVSHDQIKSYKDGRKVRYTRSY